MAYNMGKSIMYSTERFTPLGRVTAVFGSMKLVELSPQIRLIKISRDSQFYSVLNNLHSEGIQRAHQGHVSKVHLNPNSIHSQVGGHMTCG